MATSFLLHDGCFYALALGFVETIECKEAVPRIVGEQGASTELLRRDETRAAQAGCAAARERRRREYRKAYTSCASFRGYSVFRG